MRLTSAIICSLALLFTTRALSAQQVKETVVYNFGTNPNDGGIPNGGLIFDSGGNMYGTTQYGGPNFAGNVFELTPSGNGAWTETIIYNFCSLSNCLDGGVPLAGLISDTSGNLYGTTAGGGVIQHVATGAAAARYLNSRLRSRAVGSRQCFGALGATAMVKCHGAG
jgi:hypothetical protein